MSSSPWLVRFPSAPAPRLRLFCFPYSGAGPTAFATWARALPADLELYALAPPGRQARFREPPVQTIEAMVSGCTEAITPLTTLPYVLLGHSLGATVAFETARALRRLGAPSAKKLIVSGKKAPRHAGDRAPLSGLDDQAFVRALNEKYNGIPAEVLETPELLELVLPALRADIRIYETYAYTAEPPLSCPLEVWRGASDPNCSESEAQDWAAETTSDFHIVTFAGDHFFIKTAQQAVLQRLAITTKEPLE